MSNKSYVVKQQKPKSSFKSNALFFLKSLFSNDTCVDARQKPWWSALIIVLASTMIALAPIMTSYFNKTGGSILSEPTYGLEKGLPAFDQELSSKKLSLVVNNNQLDTNDAAWQTAFPTTYTIGTDSLNNPLHAYIYAHQETYIYTPNAAASSSGASSTTLAPTQTTKTVVDFVVYNAGSIDPATYYTSNVWGDSNEPKLQTASDGHLINVLVLSQKAFYLVKGPSKVSTAKSGVYGLWNASAIQGFDLKDLATKSTHGVAYTLPEKTDVTYESAFSTATVSAWKELLTEAWDSSRIAQGWTWTGISFGIFAGLALVLGLTIFLMTRGKSNPFSIYTFWECQKIAYWASFTPALLSLFAFIFPAYAILFYIFLFAMRVMWMSMRSLRPQYDAK